MEYIRPPFKIDIAGTFLLPPSLKDAQEQYRDGRISKITLRAIEDAEIRNLIEKLKIIGLEVVTDGRFRNASWPFDFMWNLEGIESCDIRRNALKLIGRLGFPSIHPILEDFMYLTGITGGDVIAKQVLPAPSLLLAELLSNDNCEQLRVFYPDNELLLADIAKVYQKLIQELYTLGCRYVQFDDNTRVITPEAIEVNNMSLVGHAPDLFVAFHASAQMLSSLNGVDAFFLDYNNESCGKTSLLWFIREQKATFGFIPSHYPLPDELDDIYEAIDEVTSYISLDRLSLCVPNAQILSNEDYEIAQKKQWDTLNMAKVAVTKLWPEEAVVEK
ncbi:methionine synthase [uncultured Bacteroides sp.]|uniref:methionine synthase n=1 Tax=uncultured Bacteroides sp. TaxID=162156 RepID=UPI002AABFADD|nr:methionine synthase [uncultured Bacteroides sp.]